MDNSYIKDTLLSLGYNLRDFGNNWRSSSIYRSGNNATALQISKENGDWYDYVLKKGGKFKELILLSKGEINEEKLKELHNYKEKPTIKTQKIYDKFILNKLIKDFSYWGNRGISEETLKLFEGGISYEGKQKSRYVFGIFDEKNNLIGSSGRWIGDYENDFKWKHIGTKTNWIFPLYLNKQELLEKKEVILVESIGDLLSLWNCGIKNVLVTFGTEISRNIIKFLLKYNFQKIIISFNNEPENNSVGNIAAQKEFDKLLKYFDTSQVMIKLPFKKDFNEMSKEEIKLWEKQ